MSCYQLRGGISSFGNQTPLLKIDLLNRLGNGLLAAYLLAAPVFRNIWVKYIFPFLSRAIPIPVKL
jgi:hypothetical protein